MLILSPFKERNVACVYYAACVYLLGVQYIAMSPPRTQTKAAIGCSNLFIVQSKLVQCNAYSFTFCFQWSGSGYCVILPYLLISRIHLLISIKMALASIFIDIKNSFMDRLAEFDLLISRIHLLISINEFLISRIHLLISRIHLLISRIHLLISINEFLISRIHLLISINEFLISINEFLISRIHLLISIKMDAVKHIYWYQ